MDGPSCPALCMGSASDVYIELLSSCLSGMLATFVGGWIAARPLVELESLGMDCERRPCRPWTQLHVTHKQASFGHSSISKT